MEGSPFSTCIQILSQARQTRMVNHVTFTLQRATVFLIAIWQKSILKVCREVLTTFGTKGLSLCSPPSWEPADCAYSCIGCEWFILLSLYSAMPLNRQGMAHSCKWMLLWWKSQVEHARYLDTEERHIWLQQFQATVRNQTWHSIR